MNKRFYVTWFLLLLLIFIHSADMLLTDYYIRDNYQEETFPIMRLAIKTFGIHPAIWFSRMIMYTYFFFAAVNNQKDTWFYFLIFVTILYWVSMTPWIFQLGLASWPFPPFLQRY